MVAAVVLGLLDVSHDDIAADYHASAGAMAAFVDWLTIEYPQALDAMTSQPPEYLEAPVEAMCCLPRARSTISTARWIASPATSASPTRSSLRCGAPCSTDLGVGG